MMFYNVLWLVNFLQIYIGCFMISALFVVSSIFWRGYLTIMTSYDVNVPWFINLIKSTTIKCQFCWLIFHFSLRTTAFCIILCVNVSFAFGHGSYTWQNLYNTFKHNLYTTFTYPLHNLYHGQPPNVFPFRLQFCWTSRGRAWRWLRWSDMPMPCGWDVAQVKGER